MTVRWTDASIWQDKVFACAGREIRWFDINSKFHARYVIPEYNSAYELKLHSHVFPDGNYVYLALPADREQLREFLARISEHELGDNDERRP